MTTDNPIEPTGTVRVWVLELPGRPPTANKQRNSHAHWSQTARETKRIRREFRLLQQNAAQTGCAPAQVGCVEVTACQVSTDRRWLQDLGACFPAVKAAIDGLVDAGLIPNDTADHVSRISFVAPDICGRDALRIQIKQVTP